MVELMAALNIKSSKRQVNTELKQLEKTLNKLRLTATLLKGDSKSQIKQAVDSIQSQLTPIKLKAKLDERAAKRAVNDALKNISFSDIKINEQGLKLKVQKALSNVQSAVSKTPVSLDYSFKKNKLHNDLTTFLSKNSKIRESSVLLKESDNLRTLFDNINDKRTAIEATDSFRLFKSEVQATGYVGLSTTDKLKDMMSKIGQIGSLFGIGAMAVRQFSKSLNTLKSNSTILTEIAKTSEMTAKQIAEIGNNSFAIASKYGTRSSGYLEGVREMARSGYDSMSKELGELSVLAQSAGDMTADSANNYLLATNAAYKYKGSIEKLTEALDGANYISNRNSATLTDIADGVRVSASYAAEAGVEIDELTAAEATMIATTKRSGSEMGRAFRSILLNLQKVSGEFDGEIIDEESLKKVEDRCHSLGVELETMTAEGAKLRNPMEVLKELAQVYNSLPDSSADKQGLISDLGGKYHANALSALLSRWDLYEKMLGEFSQGTGSSLAEAAKTADSWEGRLNALQNQWDSFVNHITSQNMIKGGISALDSLIGGAETLVDTLGAIPTLLTTITGAYTALNKDYGITQIFNPESGKMDLQGNIMGINITNIKAQKKHFEEAKIAIADWNAAVSLGKTDINKFSDAVVKNSAQLKAYLSTCTDGTASLTGYQASLRAAGIQTDALRLKTVLMTSAMTFGVSFAIQAAMTGIMKLVQSHEKLRQESHTAAQVFSQSTKSIDDYVSKYQKLHSELTNSNTTEERQYEIKRELLGIQTDLNDKYGDACGKIDLVTDAYRDQTTALKENKKALAQQFLNENIEGNEYAKQQMEGKEEYSLIRGTLSKSNEADAALLQNAEKYREQGLLTNDVYDELGNKTGEFEIKLVANPTEAKKTINQFMDEVHELAKKPGNEHVFDSTLKISSKSLMDAQKTVEKYGEQYEQILMAQLAIDPSKSPVFEDLIKSVEEYNDTVAKSKNPFTDDDVKAAYDKYQELKQQIQADDSWNMFSPITDKIFDNSNIDKYKFVSQLQSGEFNKEISKIADKTATELKAIYNAGDADNPFVQLIQGAKEYNLELEDVISILEQLGYIQKETFSDSGEVKYDSLETMISNVNSLSEGFESLDKIMASIEGKGKFDFSLLDDNKFKENFSGLGEAYTDFISQISESPKDIAACQSAFNELLGAWIQSEEVLKNISDETYDTTAAMLENMGVTNAAEVVTNALAIKKAEAAWATEDLSNKTRDEIYSLAEEIGVVGNAQDAFFSYIAQKALDEVINTTGDINALAQVCKALGLAADAWKRYYAAKMQLADIASGKSVATPHGWGGELSVHDWKKQLESTQAEAFKDSAQKLEDMAKSTPEYGGGTKTGKSGGGGGSKKAKEEQKKILDWIPAALDHVEKERQKVADIIDDENTAYEKQLSLMNELLANDEEVIRVNKEALDIYLSQWEAIRQKIIEAFGETEGNALIGKIMMGNTSPEEWKDEFSYDPDDKAMAAKIKLLEDGSEYWKTYIEQDEKYKDKVKEHSEDIKKQFEIRVNIIKESLEELKDEMSQIESEINLKEMTGRIITESDYRDMINLADDQIDLQYEQIDALEEYLSELDEGSAEWYNVKSQISSCKDAIRQCEENQAKWNEEILNLPVRRIERYLELLGFIKQDLSNFIDEQSSLGKDISQEQLQKLIELSSKQIDKLKEEHEELVKKLSNYDYGSDKFNEVQKSIQDCENEMSSLIQEQIQYNKQILDIPLNKLNDLKDQLSNIKGALDGVTNDYDTAIFAVINTVEKEIDKYNDMTEAVEKSYEARIKPLQDELDLLNKTNEARQIQLGVEQSLYGLERAKNQKTTQVVENGEIVYREDIDAVRNANKAHEDALYNKAKYELEQQIKSLEEERDALLESYDEQIDKLGEVKDRWSEIADNIRIANEAALASEIFGSGWEIKVTTGEDKDIFDAMVKNYETVEAQKEMYQKQIDATEKVSSLMEQYISAFQDGSMSYQDVLSKFDELILAAKDGFSSQEYLDAILNSTGNKDTVSALENIQNQMSGSYNDFQEYLKVANTNSETISKYTSTWEEIKKTLEEQLATLKKLAEEEAKKVSNSKPSSSGGGGKGHSSSKGPNWNTPDGPATGPAKEIEEREKQKKSLPAYKDGIENGAIQKEDSDVVKKLKALMTGNHDDNAVPIIAHPGEVVLNEEQQRMLISNFENIPVSLPTPPQFVFASDSVDRLRTFNFNMGDINLNSVDNTQKLVDTLSREFEGALRQSLSKR